MNFLFRVVCVLGALILPVGGCASDNYALSHNQFDSGIATPPADPSIIGTWRFASAGDEKVNMLFLMKFDKHGMHTSGPTPYALSQKTNYTFDGTQIVIGSGDDQVVIPNVVIKGKVMQFYGGPGAEETLLTYHRISKW